MSYPGAWLEGLDRHDHDKVAFSFSGGKDSTAVALLIEQWLPAIRVYHVDTGDLLPEIEDSVRRIEAKCLNFVRINTHVADWIAEHGLPTDLLPHTQDPIGRAMGEHQGVKLTPRYTCCANNLMNPLWNRVKADGCTLLIRGTKRCDMPTLPIESGQIADGIELLYPLQDWTHDDVIDYLKRCNWPIPSLYGQMTNAPECARCTAWWGENRAKYLKRAYPELYREYQARLTVILQSLEGPLRHLHREMTG